MSKDHKIQEELSVEEILRSIRNVINGDSSKASNNIDEDILELTEDEILVSDEVAEEAKDALKDFVIKAKESNKYNPSITIDALVADAIKQEIKIWMNANLPTIVRQIVEKEVRRLTPKDK